MQEENGFSANKFIGFTHEKLVGMSFTGTSMNKSKEVKKKWGVDGKIVQFSLIYKEEIT